MLHVYVGLEACARDLAPGNVDFQFTAAHIPPSLRPVLCRDIAITVEFLPKQIFDFRFGHPFLEMSRECGTFLFSCQQGRLCSGPFEDMLGFPLAVDDVNFDVATRPNLFVAGRRPPDAVLEASVPIPICLVAGVDVVFKTDWPPPLPWMRWFAGVIEATLVHHLNPWGRQA